MPQAHPINNPIIDAAKRELADRAQTAAPLRTANDAYNGPARIVSINTSKHKGTRKSPVADGHDTVIEQFGLASDAHAGHWHRQVSFLAAESIQTAQARGLDVHEGDFGENFTTRGINLLSLPLGTQLKLGSEVLVEISQIGKVCHTRCAIGSALAAIAGVLLCSYSPVLQPTTGAMPGIKAFDAAVFGGIGSIPGAFVGGILIGIIEAMAQAYISTSLANSIVFGVLIIVLLVKPAGLLGKYVPEKV